jgi:hypothetical protein
MKLNQEKPKPQVLNKFADWQRSRGKEQFNRAAQPSGIHVQNKTIPEKVIADGNNNQNTSTSQAAVDKNNKLGNNAFKNISNQATTSSLNLKDQKNNKFENNLSRNVNSAYNT